MEQPEPADKQPVAAAKDGKQLKVTKKMLQSVLEQCQRALELLQEAEIVPDGEVDEASGSAERDDEDEGQTSSSSSSTLDADCEMDELRDLLKSRVESPDFLEKLGASYIAVSPLMYDDSATWQVVDAKEIFEEKNTIDGNDSEDNGFVLVKEEDIVDGIACFMAAYLASLNQTKELPPNKLQEALSKTFSLKKRKGKLRKAWEGSIVVYNVASWGATAVGIYQNPAVFRAASALFWSSCHVISKLL